MRKVLVYELLEIDLLLVEENPLRKRPELVVKAKETLENLLGHSPCKKLVLRVNILIADVDRPRLFLLFLFLGRRRRLVGRSLRLDIG